MPSTLGEPANDREQVQDVTDVQMGGGFVEHEDGRVLRERLGEHHAAPFAAGELVHRTVGKVLDLGRGHRLAHLGPILRAAAAPARSVRGPPHQHELERRER